MTFNHAIIFKRCLQTISSLLMSQISVKILNFPDYKTVTISRNFWVTVSSAVAKIIERKVWVGVCICPGSKFCETCFSIAVEC